MNSSSPDSHGAWRRPAFFSHALAGARQIERLNEQGGLPVTFRAAQALEIEGGHSARLSLWRTAAREGFHSIPRMEADLIGVRFVTGGCLMRRHARADFVAEPGRAILVDFDEMREERATPGFESVGGTISREALRAGHLALEGEGAPPLPRFEPVAELDALPMRALMRTFLTLHARIRQGLVGADLLFPLMEEILVYQLLSAWPRRSAAEDARPTGTRRHVQGAVDFIDARLSERMSLAEIAAAAGIGVRSLQMAFRREIGTTPLGYVLDRRLDRVRADLLASGGGASVREIAGRWGFVHMGDFGRRFRARFGHPPSHLRRMH